MNTLSRSVLVLGALPLFGAASASDAPSHLLLRKPTVSATQIAFSYGGDLWVMPALGYGAIGPRGRPGRTRPSTRTWCSATT